MLRTSVPNLFATVSPKIFLVTSFVTIEVISKSLGPLVSLTAVAKRLKERLLYCLVSPWSSLAAARIDNGKDHC